MHLIDASDPNNRLYVSQEVFDCMQRIPPIDPESLIQYHVDELSRTFHYRVVKDKLKKQGCWIGEADGYADGELVYDVWYCSECNHCIDDGTDDPDLLPNYCPNCGAKMKGE